MRVWYCFLVAALLFTSAVPAMGSLGDWPAYRHDYGLSAVSNARSHYSINYSGVLWGAHTGGWLQSSPVAADLDGDGRLEVVVGSDDGNLYVYGYDGSLLWNYSTGARIRASPAVGNLNLDRYQEIVAGSEDGVLYAFTHDGRLLWSFKTRDAITMPPVIAELFYNNRGAEVMFTAGRKMHILSSEGVELQTGELREQITSNVAVGDVNNDGSLEFLVASSDNTVYVMDKFFNVLKQFTVDGTFITAPVAVDINGDGIVDGVFAAMDNGVYSVYHTTFTGANSCSTASCLEKSVQYLRLYPFWKSDYGRIMPPLTVADLDGDGRLETILMAGGGTLHVFDDKGFNVMTYGVNGEIGSPPSVADLDGDGKKEIVFGASDGNLYILGYPQGSRAIVNIDSKIRTSPAIADLAGDGTLEAIFGADDNTLYAVGNRLEASAAQANASYQASMAALSAGDKRIALENLSNALNLYLWLNDPEGLERATTLMNEINSSKNADIYLANANNAYRSYNFQDATAYAKEAFRLYQLTGDVKGAAAAEDLQNKVKVHLDAETHYKKGLSLFNTEGASQEAMDEIEAARAGYFAVGYAPGISKSEAVLTRMAADDYMKKAADAYAGGLYGPSKVYASKALELYSDINYDGGMNASVALLGNATREMSSGGAGGGILAAAGLLLVLGLAVVSFTIAYRFFNRSDSRAAPPRKMAPAENLSTWPGNGLLKPIKPELPPAPIAPVVEASGEQARPSRIEFLRDAARLPKTPEAGQPSDLVIMLYRLKKSGIVSYLSVRDAVDVLSTDKITIDAWARALEQRGWIRTTQANGEDRIELAGAALDTSGGPADEVTLEALVKKSFETAKDASKEAKSTPPAPERQDAAAAEGQAGSADEAVKGVLAVNGNTAGKPSNHEVVHERLSSIEDRLYSIERLLTSGSKARRDAGKPKGA